MRFKRFQIFIMLALAALLLMPGGTKAQSASTTVTIIHFADYHSHAVPFYSEGQQDQGGIARAVAYMKAMKQSTPNLLILDGGDMFNKGVPTWSDEYNCVEWPWLNGLVDAMALGNHDFDYGQDVFNKCKAAAQFPIYSANYVGANGKPLLTGSDGKPYFVKEIGGVKIGMFALAGPDFPSLVKQTNMAASSTFTDRIGIAKQIVSTLRNDEKVNAVVFFGHELREDDAALAQQVPGIDIVLGTHSHYKSELTKLPGTDTYFISPFQYLTYFDKVQLSFSDGKLTGVTGNLVKMDASQPQDPDVQAQVTKLEQDMEAKHPDRFKVLGNAAVEMSVDGVDDNETILGNWSMEVVRQAAGTNAFFSTSSSFRASIPPGPITVEQYFTAIPYTNSIVTADMTGQQFSDFLNLDVSRKGSDSFLQESGVRFKMQDGKASDIQVLNDPARPDSGYSPLDAASTYKVGVTDFMTNVAAGYKDLFAKEAANVTNTKQDIGTLLRNTIQQQGSITGALDGRMGITPASGPTPTAGIGGATPTPAALATPIAPQAAASPTAMMTMPAATATPAVASMPALPHTGNMDDMNLWLLLGLAIALLAGGFAIRTRRAKIG